MLFFLRQSYRDCSAQLGDARQSHRSLHVAGVCGGLYSDVSVADTTDAPMERLTRTSVKMDFSGTKIFEFAIGPLKFSAELRNKVRTEMSSPP